MFSTAQCLRMAHGKQGLPLSSRRKRRTQNNFVFGDAVLSLSIVTSGTLPIAPLQRRHSLPVAFLDSFREVLAPQDNCIESF